MTNKSLSARQAVAAVCAYGIVLLSACGVLSASEAQAGTTSEMPPQEKPAGAKSHLVDNVWVETEVRQVIQDISMQTGVTIICDQTVQAVVTLSVKDMPIEECLERLCCVEGYAYVKVKDYYLVGKPDPGSPMFLRTASPVRVKLTHVNCDQLKAALHPALAQYVTYDKTSQTAVIMAPQAARERVLETIELIDQPHRQVVIEAIVLELTEEGAKQLGLDWQYTNASLSIAQPNLVGTVIHDASSDMATYLEVTLRAIIQERKGRVLACPRVAVMNGQEADIFVGQERYFSLLSGQASNPYYRLESIKAGVTLKVRVQIGDNGYMVLQLEPEVSDVATETNRDTVNNGDPHVNSALPVVTRRRAKTTISVRDGQTVVIGGLLREHHRSVVEKVPLLGDIPVVGAAFRNVNQRKEQQEVVILITVHLVNHADAGPTELPTRLEQRYVSPLDAIGHSTQGVSPCTAEE